MENGCYDTVHFINISLPKWDIQASLTASLSASEVLSTCTSGSLVFVVAPG